MSQIGVLLGGAGGAQLITLLFSPVLTRLYSPDVFGEFSGWLSVIAIVAVVAPMAYPIAIVLPDTDREASGLAGIAAITTIITTTVFAMLFGALRITGLLDVNPLEYFLIVFGILIGSFLSILNYWKMRLQEFRAIGSSTLVRSLVLILLQFLLSLWNPSSVSLLLSFVLAQLTGVCVLLLGSKPSLPKLRDFRENRNLAKKYIDFPFYKAPEQLLSALSQNVPMLLILGYYGPVVGGAFALASRVLIAPVTLTGKVITDILYPKLSALRNQGDDLSGILKRSIILLSVFAAVPFALVGLFGTEILSLLFGQEWLGAGVFAEILSFWLFVELINRGCIAAVAVLRWQGGLLAITATTGALRIFAVWLVGELSGTAQLAVSLYSALGALSGLAIIFTVLSRASKPIET